jgi:outer membrane protein TolC
MRQEQYRHGTLSITDLLIAENNAKNAELEFVYEKYNLQYNLMLIAFYCEKT